MIQVFLDTYPLLGPVDLAVMALVTLSWPLAMIGVALERRGRTIWPIFWAGFPMAVGIGALSLVAERQRPALFEMSRVPARNVAALAAETYTRGLAGEWVGLFSVAVSLLGVALISGLSVNPGVERGSHVLRVGLFVAAITALTAPALLGDVYGWLPVFLMGAAISSHTALKRGAEVRVLVRTALLGALACLLLLWAAMVRGEAAVYASVAMLEPARDLVRLVQADALLAEVHRKSWVVSVGVMVLVRQAWLSTGFRNIIGFLPAWTPVVALLIPLGWFHVQGAKMGEQVLEWGAAPALAQQLDVPVHNAPLDAQLRTVGGCLVTGPPFVAANFGHRPERSDLRPCASEGLLLAALPYTARPTVSVAANVSTAELVSGVLFEGYGEINLLTQLPIADWPDALAAWKMSRVGFSVLPPPVQDAEGVYLWDDTRERPLRGSLLWTGKELWGSFGHVEAQGTQGLVAQLTPVMPEGRFDLVLLPSESQSVQDAADACLAVRTVRNFGTRCVLAAGDATLWRGWAVSLTPAMP